MLSTHKHREKIDKSEKAALEYPLKFWFVPTPVLTLTPVPTEILIPLMAGSSPDRDPSTSNLVSLSTVAQKEEMTEYLVHSRNGLIFKWCPCSESGPDPGAVSVSVFLTKLHRDLREIKRSSLSYLVLPKPLHAYQSDEDTYVDQLKAYIRRPMDQRIAAHLYCQQELNLEPGFDYLLLNYLENIGFMHHGCSIRFPSAER